MSAYAELASSVREPMRKWWGGTGGWLLVGASLIYAVTAALTFRLLFGPPSWSSGLVALQAMRIVSPLLYCVVRSLMPVIWLLAAFQALDLTQRTAIAVGVTANARSLFAICVAQGFYPLAAMWILRFTSSLIHDHLQSPVTFSPWNVVSSGSDAWMSLLTNLPVVLVALCLLALTGHRFLPLVLFGAKVLADLAVDYVDTFASYKTAVHPLTNAPWHPTLLSAACLVMGTAILIALIYGLLANRRWLWQGAYWAMVGGLVGRPVLTLAFHYIDARPISFAEWASFALCYDVQGHGAVAQWIGRNFYSWFPPEKTLLSAAGPLSSLIWFALLCGGLFAFLYWLLGRPWERRDQGSPALPEARPAAV